MAHMPESQDTRPTRDSSWLIWARSAFAVIVVTVLLALGVANITLRSRWHEVEDGVLWASRSEGVTAIEVDRKSAGAAAGIERGDVLVAINGLPVQSPGDVTDVAHRSADASRLTYSLLRLGTRQALEVSLAPIPQGSSLYYVLSAVGLFTLVVGGLVRLRRPNDQATLHFFWLCTAFFGAYTFSFNGPFDRLDWIFYWGDAIAIALLPPLLLHFTVVFPARQASGPMPLLPLIYAPALLIIAGRLAAVVRGSANGAFLAVATSALDRAEQLQLCAGAVVSAAVLARAFQQITTTTARRQLRWLAWGTALGAGPFAFGYALPWALGVDPPFALQFTAVPLGLVPLTFASAIVRYRLRDIEVIVKRTLAYAAFLGATLALYAALLRLTSFLVGPAGNPGDEHTWIIALLTTIVVVLLAQPVKEAVHTAIDRMFYRDRYDYRRALVAFARELNSDLNVVRLSQRLVARVVETLVIDRMALMLADDRSGDFTSIGDYGFSTLVPRLSRTSSMMPRLDAGTTVALDDPIAAARFAAEEVEFWRDAGAYYFVPCVFEGRAIAVLALGRKESDEPFNSEDLALLTAVASQVATAIENGRLYRELHRKAEELDRMREFNENILESLDDGLAVFDRSERIVRWNRALEGFYGVTREAAIGRTLGDVFDLPFVEALRAARQEHRGGATLYRVPIEARHRAAAGDGAAAGVSPLSARVNDAGGFGTAGAKLLVNATEVPLRNPSPSDRSIAGHILLIEDITERVRLEEQLQISEKMASIGLLAAGVAHEVNTPLTGISSFTQMLLDGADEGDPKTTLLKKIERQSFRAAKIVNGLLNLSRPVAAGNDPAEADLNAIILDVFALLEHQFEVARIKVRRELAATPVPVRGIEHQLQQVFLNLFLNARDAMPRGGWLSVTTQVSGGRAVAEIADTGSGIPSEHLARIYDPFFTTKAIGRGTGLGLSITYGIVRDHDGTIHCDSAVGQGTRFIVSLPLAQELRRSAQS